MSESIILTGGCLCGAIRYSADTMPFASDYCHCTQCRRSSGGPVGVWMDFKAEQVSWSGAQPKEYESSQHVNRGFCSECGSSLSYNHNQHPEYLSLTVATLDNPALVTPTYHIFTDSQIPWFDISDSCKRYPREQTSS